MSTRTGWFRTGAALASVLVAAAACDRDPPFGPVPPGQGVVIAQGYFEYDGQPGPGGGDEAVPGLRFQVLLPGSTTPVATGSTGGDGTVRLGDIPVGTYDLRVDPAYLGDTLMVTQIDTSRVTLTTGDTVLVRVGVTPPTRTIAQVRALPEGSRAWVVGMALNTRSTSLDGAVHVLEDATGDAIRVRFAASADGSPGDSVRVLGRAMNVGSRRYLDNGIIRVQARDVRRILPLEVGVGEARSAGGGAHDARLVVIRAGTVTGTVAIPFVGTHVTVQDGPDQLLIVLPLQNGFGNPNLVAGQPVVSVTGLLVPDDTQQGVWRLVPRGGADAQFGPPPPAGD